jgi:NAD+ kinase
MLTFYQATIDDAILSGKIELVKIPVEFGTALSMDQVEKFASLIQIAARSPLSSQKGRSVKKKRDIYNIYKYKYTTNSMEQ